MVVRYRFRQYFIIATEGLGQMAEKRFSMIECSHRAFFYWHEIIDFYKLTEGENVFRTKKNWEIITIHILEKTTLRYNKTKMLYWTDKGSMVRQLKKVRKAGKMEGNYE